VERAIGVWTPEQHEKFLAPAPELEDLLRQGGIKIIKHGLDISLEEQTERMEVCRLTL